MFSSYDEKNLLGLDSLIISNNSFSDEDSILTTNATVGTLGNSTGNNTGNSSGNNVVYSAPLPTSGTLPESKESDSTLTNEIIKKLVEKRIQHLNYIQKIHKGEVYWMNTCKISIDDMKEFFHESTLEKRVEQWFFLGISLAPLLQVSNGWWFLRALVQLLEEYEYHFSNLAVQGMKYLKAMTSTSVQQLSVVTGRSVKPSIQRVGRTVVYEFLRTPNVPCELDYCQVIFSLCDMLTIVYRKILAEKQILLDSLTINHLDIREIVQKIDSKFKHEFFGLISRDLNTLAMMKVKQQLNDLETIFNENYNHRGEKKQNI